MPVIKANTQYLHLFPKSISVLINIIKNVGNTIVQIISDLFLSRELGQNNDFTQPEVESNGEINN